jgi:hypothetical protein
MKRLLILTLLMGMCAPFAFGSIITNDNTRLMIFESSYDLSPYHYFGDYLSSWLYLAHPQFTNNAWMSGSTSGDVELRNETALERKGLAYWASGQHAIGLIMADDNSSYSSNTLMLNLTNTLSAPTNFYNGSAYTNEGGWCATQSITWIGLGAIPHNSMDGDSGEIARNNAVTNMFTLLARPFVNMWYPLWNPVPGQGWGPDETNGITADWNPGSHPNAPLSLTMAINIARNLAGADTNVSLAVVDWNAAAIVSTNHCVVASVNRTGNVLTFTRHDDRLPMAWDVPNATTGITNDCRDAFRVLPSMANAFWFTLGVTNAPTGQYVVAVNGTSIGTFSSTDFVTNNGLGLNMFTNMLGPDGDQRAATLGDIRDKDGTDRVTLTDHNAGSLGVNGWADLVNWNSHRQANWDAGHRGDTLIADAASDVTDLAHLDATIRTDAQPVTRTYTITQILPAQTIYAPIHR